MGDDALPAEIIASAPPRLSSREAQELIERVADLAKLRGDLPAGLRASAASCDSQPLARALRRVADQLEQGRSAESALGDADWGLPSHLAGLLAAAIRTGDCGVVLSELADIRASHDEAWRETRSAVAYPLVMLVLTLAVFAFLLNYLAPQLVAFYEEFELPLPASTSSLHWFRTTGQWLAAGWVAALAIVAAGVRILAPWSLYCRARSSLPIFGKIFLWSGLAELLGLVRVLVQSGLPLVEALRLAAAGTRDGHVADVARRVARACEQGTSLAKALGEEPATFPPTIVPILQVGERHGDLPGALEAAANLVGDRHRSRTQLIRQLGPPILFLIIATFVISMPVALILTPMTELVTGLSGGMFFRPAAAPPAGPFAAINELYTANLLMLLPLALALSFSRRMLYGDRRPGRSTWLESTLWLLEVLAWTFAAIGYLFFTITPLTLLLLAAAAYVLIGSYFRIYGSERDGLLSALAIAAQRSTPLTDAAWGRYQERVDRLGRKCIALAEALANGMALPDALRRAWIRLPFGQRIAVEAADATGDVGGTLGGALERQRSAQRELAPVAAKFVYCLWTVMIMVGVLTFVMLKIVPVFARMFEEFDLPLPDSTIALINASNWIVDKWATLALPLGLAMLALGILFDDNLFRFVAFFFPILHWLRLRQYGAWLLRGLATLIRGKRPMAPAIAAIAERFPILMVGWHLHKAAQAIETGQGWTTALQKFGFLSKYDAAFLAAAERNNHLAWALDEAADNIERRRMLRLRYQANLLFPILIVMLGALTAFVFVSLFMPLIALIQGLSPR